MKRLHLLMLGMLIVVGFSLSVTVTAQSCIDPATGRPVPCPPTAAPTDPAPPPDRDGDGVYDNADRCPDRGGPAQNFGCPEDVDTGPQAATAVPTAATVSVIFPEDGKCWVGNESPFNVNRRKYPSLNAPITGQLLPGQITRAVGDYTDPDGLKWYSLAIFADPNSNAYIVDWVASSVVIATPACNGGRAEALNLAAQSAVRDWDFEITPIQIRPPQGVLQICDGQAIVTYIGDILDCDGNPIPEPFDGMTSQAYCDGVMVSLDELPECLGAEGIIIINGAPVLPAGIKIHPPDPGMPVLEGGLMPILNTPALLLFGAFGEPMPDDEEPPMPMLVAMGISSGLSEVGFNPQPEPPAGDPYDFSSNPLMFNPQPEPPASPFDISGGGGWIAMQMVNPQDSGWMAWMSTYGLPPTIRGASGFWLITFENGNGATQTAMIPMSGNDLSWYGFNPQPEPPALFLLSGDGVQVNSAYTGDNLPDINIVGFNPQPEPPAMPDMNIFGFNPQPEPPALVGLQILSPDDIVLYDASVDYNTARPQEQAVLVPLGDGSTFMNIFTSNIVVCPTTGSDLGVPACVEFVPSVE